MESRRAAVLLLFAASVCCHVAAQCPSEPGAARAACFCQTVTEYRYYADTANGCTGAMWCYAPNQSTYVSCPSGTLFSNTQQYCDWAFNVQCTGTPLPSPPPLTPSLSPPPPTPSPSPPPPSPSPLPSSCTSVAPRGGSCGGSKKACCPNGQCCSKSGYCGVTVNHCGTGCQPAFGQCSSAPSPSPKPSPSPSPKPSPSPSPKPSPSPSPKPSPSPSPSTPPPAPSPSPTPPPPSPSPSPPPPSSPSPSGLLPSGPIVSVYYQTWSAPWASKGSDLDLAKMPSYTNVVIVSFAKPDCIYSKGSLNLANTGLQFSSTGIVVRDAIAALKAAQPNTRVLLAVGGATYWNFAAMNTACIKGIVEDFGYDGVDLDYEPTGANCQVKSTGITCATDAESVAVTTALRSALPQGQYLLSTASYHVGAYGEGAFKASQPASQYTGVNLAMSKCPAGQALDLINVMAYDAGNKMSTGFDWSESYRAHRAAWPNQAIAIGVEIPPEAWGGNILTLPEVTTRALYARDYAGTAPYGLMLWSIHKPGCPSAQQITSAACTAYGMQGCSTPLPQPQSSCGGGNLNPSPPPSSPPEGSPPPTGGVSPSPAPPSGGGGSCSSYAGGGGACGAANGGACCSNGQCCSQYGWCGVTSGHCGVGCQFGFGACSGSPPPPTPSPSPPTPPVGSSPSPPPSQGGTGSVADYISPAQFEAFFLHRNDPACASNGFYTYAAFLAAAAAFPGFGTSSLDPAVNKRELAAFLGQISHETTGGWPTAPDGPYSWGLCWINEGGTITPAAPYCAATPEYPCAPGKQYYGRGPMQLSWNYNYIQAGQVLGFDGLNNPELVAQDAVLAFKTAVWFWMAPQTPKPSCHDIMQGIVTPTAADLAAGRLPGFGWTTNVINGGLECGSGTSKAQELDRIGYYKRYCDIFGVTYGDNLDCANQQHY